MDGVEILAQARAAGIYVKAHGETLAISGPSRAAPLAQQLIACKADILPLLQAEGTGASQMCPLSCGQVDGGLAVADADMTPTVRTQAMAWLATTLASGPQPESKLALEAQAAGISKASLRRAKTALGVESKRQGKHWVWVSPQGVHRQGAQGVQGVHGQDDQQGAQPQGAQDAQRQQANPKTITGADGHLYTVTLARCRRCSGSNWGPSGHYAADGAEIWTCLDCLRTSPKIPPAPCASDRDA